MRNIDCTRNPLLAACTYNDFGITEGIMLGISIAVSAAGSLIGAAGAASAANQQAAMQEQQAQQAQQIANYNAEMQRQNNEVAYQLALYQSQANQQMSAINQAMAMQNAALADVQATGARMQYEQGLQNAEQQRIQAEAARAQSREQVDRERQDNDKKLALIRAKYGASGVTSEGSPLEVLGDAAKLGELAVQDIAYAGELASRKQYREAEITKFKAGFSLIDEMGYGVEAANYRLEAQKAGYESSLYEYDSEIAGAKYRIGLNEARLTELSGESQAWGFQAEAAQSRAKASAAWTGGLLGVATSVAGGISTGYGWSQQNKLAKTATTSYNKGYSSYNSSFAASKMGTGSSASAISWS